MAGDEFSRWIEYELSRRGWKASDLAREAGIDQGTLSNVLNGARGAGLTFCTRVAAAFDLPPEMVLRQAGLLPSAPTGTATAQEMAHLFAQLTPGDQRRTIAIARALLLDAARGKEPPARCDTVGKEMPGHELGTPVGWSPEDAMLERDVFRRRRRPGALATAVLMVLGIIIVGAVVGILGVAFVEGSWWYTVATDRALGIEGQGRAAVVRERLAESGSAPQAVVWLDRALAPGVHPSDVRAYLIAARDELAAKDEDEMASSVRELDALIWMIRPGADPTLLTPFPVSTVGSTTQSGP